MPNAGLTGVSEPSYTDELLTTDYQEFAFITIDFWVISTITDSEFYTITSGEVEGKLYTDYEQQEEPLTLTTTFDAPAFSPVNSTVAPPEPRVT